MGQGHPECPQRLRAITQHLQASGLSATLQHFDAPLADLSAVHRAHGESHVAALSALAREIAGAAGAGASSLRYVDPDTAMNAHSWDAALRAAGAAVAATDAVIAGDLDNAFCATRPPGHHACRDQAMGFCLINNVAVAALHALSRHGLQRVAIVDFDVHHGNGTEDIVAGDPRILMLSFYQHPFYPSGGSRSKASNLVNLPVPAGTGGAVVRALVQNLWLPRLEQHRPEMIFVSAGFDAHRDDHLGQMALVEDDYGWITEQLMQAAERHGRGRVVSCLEGGYNLNALGRSVETHLRVLTGS